jgi:hypothetical protein
VFREHDARSDGAFGQRNRPRYDRDFFHDPLITTEGVCMSIGR